MNQTRTFSTIRSRCDTILPDLTEPRFWLKLLVLVAAVRAAITLHSHFWLDETGTVWAVRGGFAQLTTRCTVFPLSLLYATLILLLRSIGLTSEWSLRVPSYLAVSAAGYVLFRAARRHWGRLPAWLVVATFVSLPSVAFAACDARPYALALLCTVLSTVILIDLLERPTYGRAIGYSLAIGLAINFHILFATVLAVHLVVAAYQHFRGFRLPPTFLLTAASLFTLTAVPQIYAAYHLTENPASHSFAARPGFGDLLLALVPLQLAVSLVPLLGYSLLPNSRLHWRPSLPSQHLILGILLTLSPPIILYVISLVSPVGVFIDRYYLPYTIGLAILYAYLLASIRPYRVVTLAIIVLATIRITGVLYHWPPRHTAYRGDWAAALSYVDRNTLPDGAPVLIRSQYIESDFLPLTPIQDNPLFSQLSSYPSTSCLIPLAASFSKNQSNQLDLFLSRTRHNTIRFLLLAFDGPRALAPLEGYLIAHIGRNGQVRELANFDGITVTEFILSSR